MRQDRVGLTGLKPRSKTRRPPSWTEPPNPRRRVLCFRTALKCRSYRVKEIAKERGGPTRGTGARERRETTRREKKTLTEKRPNKELAETRIAGNMTDR